MTALTFITVEQLAAVFALEFPQLVRCRDYWVAHPVDRSDVMVQTGHAWIVEWSAQDVPQPDDAAIQTLWAKWSSNVLGTEACSSVRAQRDALLVEADHMVAMAEDRGDAAVGQAARQYRQALRDVPQQPGFPFDISWPVAPGPGV
jgi:hypothetical protein